MKIQPISRIGLLFSDPPGIKGAVLFIAAKAAQRREVVAVPKNTGMTKRQAREAKRKGEQVIVSILGKDCLGQLIEETGDGRFHFRGVMKSSREVTKFALPREIRFASTDGEK
ncbi:MAG: hypothetical protein A2Z78_00585 [Candidatus Nealsonbacteria bacterium RBG_13_36_15]|uniref:Uncharacterized protein n=1 Tax=Candidatus Nealsonbacteria bacterium RBG_13_36_15 TaxID=1801660 RepID=A0A1G2DWV3_9BACT|nr:MAG: hypothetical protein A2Z78_00585 [Candidatus Nealsonbacteria bacterium RBG_13_36_15]